MRDREKRGSRAAPSLQVSLSALHRFIMYQFPTQPTTSFPFSLANLGFDSSLTPLINIPQPSSYSPVKILTILPLHQALYQQHQVPDLSSRVSRGEADGGLQGGQRHRKTICQA